MQAQEPCNCEATTWHFSTLFSQPARSVVVNPAGPVSEAVVSLSHGVAWKASRVVAWRGLDFGGLEPISKNKNGDDVASCGHRLPFLP